MFELVGLRGIPLANFIHAGVKLFCYLPVKVNEKITTTLELDDLKDVGKATLTRIKY